jgi:hypothetical protein
MLQLGQPGAGARPVQALMENEPLVVVVDLRSDLSQAVGALGG